MLTAGPELHLRTVGVHRKTDVASHVTVKGQKSRGEYFLNAHSVATAQVVASRDGHRPASGYNTAEAELMQPGLSCC